MRRRPAWLGHVGWSLLAFGVAGSSCGPREDPLPRFAELPSLSLLDQNGSRFVREDLEERISVVSFIFTSCPTICPRLSAKMAELQQRYGDRPRVQLVSISVDPKHDTPAVLKAYGARYGADPRRWRFLTGDSEAVNRLVVRGFRTAMGEPEPSATGRYDILHSAHLVLVDSQAAIRGYYAVDEEGMRRLHRDIDRLF